MSELYGHNGGPPLVPLDPKAAGWIRVNRDIREHHLVGFGLNVRPCDDSRGSYSRSEAFLDLVMECRYCEGRINNGGHIMTIQPGQLIGAVSWLANRWNWTPRTVRWFLGQLEADEMISRTTMSPDNVQVKPKRGNHNGNQANIITICNYSKYQIVQHEERQSDRQSSDNQTSTERLPSDYSNNKDTKVEGNKEDSPPGVALPAAEPQPALLSPEELLVQAGIDVEAIKRLTDPGRMRAFEEFEQAEAVKRQQDEAKRLRAERTASENARRKADAQAAYSLYNKAAAHWGFSLCESMTERRTAKLLKRIDDIGGLEKFRLALRAIGKDEFLAGKVVKDGHKPFRLDFDRLLSTDSGLGDVLARLLDKAAVGDRIEDQQSPNGKQWGWWRPDVGTLSKLKPDYWQRRFEALKPNGLWPWWDLGPPPGHAEALTDWDAVMGTNLSEVYRGEVQHD